jgi:DNA polymerase-4
MPALCQDCLDWSDAPAAGRPCPACGSRRRVAHDELGALAVAHLDCDAFYAAIEKRDDPALADRPVIVGGGRRGVVATCCYVARLAGVRSAMPMFKARRLCPEAVVLTPRMDHYAAVSRRIRARMEALTPLVEPLSLDEAFLDLSGTERLLGAPPALVMARLARDIEESLGITVSIGLSHNKFLAKIASELDKPRGFSVIGRAEAPDVLAPMPVSRIWGVGATLARTLERDGITRIGDLRAREPEALVARYGAMGARLHALAHARDDRRVSPDRPVKSISNETTFEADIGSREALLGHLWRLSVKCSDRTKARDLAGRTVTLKLRTAGFRTLTRRTSLDAATNGADPLFRAGLALLDRALDAGPFRLLGIGLGGLERAPHWGEGALLEDPASARARAEAARDRIRARFGDGAIILGRSLR